MIFRNWQKQVIHSYLQLRALVKHKKKSVTEHSQLIMYGNYVLVMLGLVIKMKQSIKTITS